MTCIELFDRNFTDNVCSCLAFSPQKVILLGKEKNISKYAKRFEEIFRKRGCKTEFSSVTLERTDMKKILETLTSIVEENISDNCTFDLTGGDDQYLVAVGIILERYKGRVQAHCINARNGEMIDCDCDGAVIGNYKQPKMTFEENVKLYGGVINETSSSAWKFTEEFLNDLEEMWKICISDPKKWNIQTAYLNAMSVNENSYSGLSASARRKTLKAFGTNARIEEEFDVEFIKNLHNAGVLSECFCDSDTVRIQYKNEQIKRCLLKAGQVLELKVLAVAKSIEENGENFYNDAQTGIYITWENQTETKSDDVFNEIDVVLMKGMVPVFVSCKNGKFSSNELYKLSTVAEKFGGKYAKKIVVTTCKECASNMRSRATEHKIGIVLITKEMSEEKIKRKIKSLWSNNG